MLWSRPWSMDRYQAGSAHIDQASCDPRGCEMLGRFSFVRVDAVATIEFAADVDRGADPSDRLARPCYEDTTTGMQDRAE